MSARHLLPAKTRVGLLLTCAVLAGSVTPAFAQTGLRQPFPAGSFPRAGSWEIGGGVVYVGGFDMGERPAELTPNLNSDPFDLFTTSSTFESAAGLAGRLGVYVTPSISIEGAVRYSRPVLAIEITDDAEDAPNLTAEEELSEYLFEGSVLWHFGRARWGAPFVSAGAGYLRQLHENDELVETGTEFHAGGGVKIWFSERRRRLGLRGDVSLSIRRGVFDVEDKTRVGPVAGVGLMYLF